MSNSVEDEVVSMKFDNKQFESGVATSLTTLGKLQAAMSFKGASNGLSDISKGVGSFSMEPMASAIDGVSSKWLALTTVAVTAISNITNKVVDAGLKMGKSLVVDPFTQGFSEYSTNLNSIQTIIANTGAKLPVVNGVLKQLNTYSDKTIYNFGQMAQNIGRFTAAGVKMGPAVDAIKGMANTAALSGATADQLNSAMYQMSQALSTGVIRLMDWNSLANANMGGQNIQKALQATAESGKDAGAAMKGAIEKAGNFRDSLQAGWLTGDIFTKTMKVMAGQVNKATGEYEAFTVAQLKGMGYSDEAAKELNGLSKRSIDAATKVKTISQAFDVVKESIGSGWAQVFQNVFGDFNQSKKLWTGVTKYITTAVGNVFGALNKVLFHWNKMGGRDAIIGGLKQAFKDLYRFFVPIKNAFKEVFPPATGNTLITISKLFEKFFGLFRLNVKHMHIIREIFVGIFTAIKFGFTIIGDAFKLFKTLFGLVANSGLPGVIGKIAKAIGSLGSEFQKSGFPKILAAFKQGTKIVIAFVQSLAPLIPVLRHVADAVKDLASQGYSIAEGLIGGLLEGLSVNSIQTAMVELANNIVKWIKDALGIHSPSTVMIPIGVNIILGIAEGIKGAGPRLVEALQTTFKGLAWVISELIYGLGQAFKDAMQNLNLQDVLDIINTILTGGFLLAATNIAKSFSGVSKSASGVLDQISGSLKAMQSKVKAEIIKSIAVSVLLLAGAAYILSTLDGKKLAVSMGAIAGLMAALTGSMKVLMGGDVSGQSYKDVAKKAASMATLGAAMVLFSTAIVILSGAVAIMGNLDKDTMTQGLEGVGAIVAGIVAATAILSKTGGGATIFATAAALVVLAVGLTEFVGVMMLYSKLDWSLIAEGGGKAAAVILAVGLAMRGFGKFAITGSIGLVIASAALLILAKALNELNKIGGKDMIKVVLGLVVVLAAMAGAAMLMSAAEGGALSMVVMAAGIFILSKALIALSKVKGTDLAKAITFMVLALAALALTALAMGPAIPLIDALGAAIFLLGAGMALAGLGVLAFATALGILAIVGPAGFQAVYDGVLQMLELLPKIGHALGEFVLSFAQGLVDASGPLFKAIFALLGVIADAVIQFMPKIAQVFRALINTVFTVLESYIGRFIRFGVNVIVAFLKGVEDAIPRIAHHAANIVIAFLDAIGKEEPRIIRAAFRMIGNLVTGITQAIDDSTGGLLSDAKDIGWAIIHGILDGLSAGLHWVTDKAKEIAHAAIDGAKHVFGINSPSKAFHEIGSGVVEGLVNGLDKNSHLAEKSSAAMANKSIEAAKYAFRNSKTIANGLMDVRPKISPVLDLSQLEKDALQIGGKLGQHSINTKVSGQRARDIAADKPFSHRGDEVVRGGDVYQFNQEINSPKAVNHVAAYRGTKSQIALFKEVTGR